MAVIFPDYYKSPIGVVDGDGNVVVLCLSSEPHMFHPQVDTISRAARAFGRQSEVCCRPTDECSNCPAGGREVVR